MNVKRIGLIVVILLLGGLFLLNRKDVELTKQDSFIVTPIGNTGYELNSTIHLNNPNLLSSTVKTISEKFYLQGRSISILNLDIQQGIPGMKETEFPINVRFTREDLMQVFPGDTSFANKRVEVSVIGEITFSNMMSSGKITISQKDSLTIPGL